MTNRLARTAGTLLIVLGIALAGASSATATQGTDHKVGICHRTASDTNPYVYINVDVASLQSHLTDGKGHFSKTWKSAGTFRGIAHVKGDLKRDYIASRASDCDEIVQPTPTPEVTPSPSSTPSPEPSASSEPTPTPNPTSTPTTSPTPSSSPIPTSSPEPSGTPPPTETPFPRVTAPPTDTASEAPSTEPQLNVFIILGALMLGIAFGAYEYQELKRRRR